MNTETINLESAAPVDRSFDVERYELIHRRIPLDCLILSGSEQKSLVLKIYDGSTLMEAIRSLIKTAEYESHGHAVHKWGDRKYRISWRNIRVDTPYDTRSQAKNALKEVKLKIKERIDLLKGLIPIAEKYGDIDFSTGREN